MSGKYEPRWSARQRLVVLTFDDAKTAETFDLHRFDPKLVDVQQLDDLLWTCRGVIDEWDDGHPVDGRIGGLDFERMQTRIDGMRAALYELRQGAMT